MAYVNNEAHMAMRGEELRKHLKEVHGVFFTRHALESSMRMAHEVRHEYYS